MTHQFVIAAGLLVSILALIFIVFFVIARQRQNQLFVRHKNLTQEFDRQLLQSQLEIQEQTFNHISQEIHDNVGQIMSLAKIQASIIKESGSLEIIDDLKENISRAIGDLRDIAKSLSSERIRSKSIVDSVQIESDRINKSGIIHATVSIEGSEITVDEQKKQILFRIIQECLQNIIKHAQATEVGLYFFYNAECLEVSIIDNGKGFDVSKEMSSKGGLGLQNMNSRSLLIGGSFAIESKLNRGSTVTIKTPYE